MGYDAIVGYRDAILRAAMAHPDLVLILIYQSRGTSRSRTV